MRILVLCSDTGVRVGDATGASVHLRAISHAFAALGHSVEVVGIAPSDPTDLLGWRMPVHVVPHPGRSEGLEREQRKLDATRTLGVRATQVAGRLRPHLIYERLSLFGSAGLAVAADTGAGHLLEINALLTLEETTWRGLHLGSLARKVEARVLRSADLRVAVSDEVLAAIAPYAAGGAAITVPNGVDTDRFATRYSRQRSRAAFGLPPHAALLGFTGSLRPWHGLDIAIAALADLPERVQIVVAGSGPVQEDLAQQAAAEGLGHRVHWLGQLPHDRIPAMLAACDLALAPYPHLPNFGFSPLKLYEYLAAGVPVVASDIGQVRAALEQGRWGRLVPPGDRAALVAAVTAELAAPAAGQERAAAARQHALAHHGWTDRAEQILSAALTLGLDIPTPPRRRDDDALAR